MAISPRKQRPGLNQTATLKRGIVFGSTIESEDEDETEPSQRKLKLPDILLSKIAPLSSTESYDIPGLKTIQTQKKLHTRNLSEAKGSYTDRSIDVSSK